MNPTTTTTITTKPDPGDTTMNPARLVLVDLENLTGNSPQHCAHRDYATALHQLTDTINLDPTTDRLVVGVNPALAYTVHDAAPFARIVTRRGENGADQRLCQELADLHLITRRFPHVLLASGDGAFADPITHLAHHGITTTVAALPRHLSTRLRLAAQQLIWLRPPATGLTGTTEAAA